MPPLLPVVVQIQFFLVVLFVQESLFVHVIENLLANGVLSKPPRSWVVLEHFTDEANLLGSANKALVRPMTLRERVPLQLMSRSP